MIQSTELLLCLTIMLSSTMFCNYYPMDAKACISKTDGIQCYFNEFENACLPTRETSHGCINTLNKLSCLNQLTQNDGTEATCIFTNRCLKAKKQHFKNLGCALNYSQYACMNAQKSDCIWNDKCEQFQDQISQEDECSKVFKNRSVTPSLCQKIQNIRCMSNGFYGQYKCIQVTEQMLMSMECSQLGLNEQGCIEIITIDQACIFENNQCKQIENAQNCNLKLNRLGCLTIMNPNIKCQWKNNKCLDMTEITLQCDQIYDVNPSVCQSFKGICQYDNIKKKCRLPTNTELQNLKCNTDGLTKQACLQIKNQYCTFFRGICEELSQIDLQQFQCKMELNEDACINITTQFQYCQWDGLECKRISVNQQTDCPLLINNHITKFNGNVCQSITKPNVQCKYNAERHLCEISNQLDSCNTPYLNLQGCLNLMQIGITCQWSNEKCVNIKIINNKTTCNSLKFVNPIACSQVFESNSLGCYFDSTLMQCKSINIQNSNNEEKQFLQNTDCSNPLFGLNKVACASIMKPGQICRWTQNQCIQIKSKEQISQVQCISLQYVNQQVCALVEFMKEPCRYSQQELGCVNSIVNGMQCEEIGLNTYACAIASKNCYFDTEANQCKRLNDTQKSLLSIIKCDQNSPTIGLCQAITTYNQLCTWSYRANKCQSIDVPYNSKCLDFSGKNVIVNKNVCASIEHEFPEYDYTKGEINKQDLNRGLCKFNIKKGVCEKLNQFCTTPCCTENDKIGINAHSCSRYSNPSFFCYFSHNLRCTQLTNKQISVINDETAAAYYNYNKFKCSQMTVKSCSRINWSTKQRCYYNGRLCLNVNFNNYLQFDQFLIANAVNEYACLAIEAIINENNNKKYFQYDKSIRKCNSVTPNYSNSCQIPGNRNICLAFTKEKYCKWNVLTLKCEDMTDDEFDQIISCNSNQNFKACIENNNLACQFFEKSDSCIDTYPNEDCLLYDGTLGKVSKKVCTQIIKDGQMCKFQDNKCIQFNDSITNECEYDGINSLACYNLTTLECRWDVTTQTCYQNYSKIDDLRCEDNLNKILCIKVTKEPCVWDNQRFKCLKLIQTSQIFFSSLNQNNQYNELTCHLIQNSYEYQIPKCVLITEKNNNCSKQYINKYACLQNTQGYHCYYDPNEINLNLRCKQFIGEQTQCTTTTLINIQICMEIPKSCYFDSVKQICTPVDIDEQVLCSDLMNDQTRNYNYLSCASISENLTQTYGPNQCYENTNQVQTCNYEKYCFWNSITYNCSIKQLHSLKWVPKQEGCSSDDPDCKDKCSGNIKEYVNECSYRYSKALCLEMNKKQCFFDINQGGCNEIQNNEIYIGDCDNLYQYTEDDTTFNNCNKSMNQNAICVSELVQDSPQGCQSFKRTIFKCVQLQISNDNTCDTSTSSPSPGLCSIASTFCRFDKVNQKCTSNQSCDCDGSFSQSMCESCNCNFEQLGYCQSKDIMINAPKIITIEITIENISQIEIKTNKYYLCNQVNLLKTSQPEILCSNVEQSCMYNDTCIDVTGYQCNDLMNNLVSSKACTQCKGDKMYYDSDHFCKILNPQNTPNLDSLNQASCVSSHFDKPLQWDQSKCKEVNDFITLSDCSLYNPKACKDIQQCWIHPETNLCTIFNENIGNCEQQYTQEYCLLSNKEMCYWNQDDKVCRKAQEKQSNYVCEDANKFGCLNLENQLCVWSNTQKCQSIKQIDLSVQSCTDFLTQKYDFYNGSICTLLVVPLDVKDKSCFRDSNYQCRSSIITDKLQCDTSGLNEYSCINSTIGKCKFSNSICSSENSQILDCEQDDILLNLNSCINQKKTCKFEADWKILRLIIYCIQFLFVLNQIQYQQLQVLYTIQRLKDVQIFRIDHHIQMIVICQV
ncbi:unnamed protein product [Paramecium primaurelia]|uniref:Transmembrane protein n=1 Tax=Paramecium primaurelia TaxID=5886 RepID=A0A8S1LAN5_PARPR|nr:unnamed protein product [Paramecium primaurelia]